MPWSDGVTCVPATVREYGTRLGQAAVSPGSAGRAASIQHRLRQAHQRLHLRRTLRPRWPALTTIVSSAPPDGPDIRATCDGSGPAVRSRRPSCRSDARPSARLAIPKFLTPSASAARLRSRLASAGSRINDRTNRGLLDYNQGLEDLAGGHSGVFGHADGVVDALREDDLFVREPGAPPAVAGPESCRQGSPGRLVEHLLHCPARDLDGEVRAAVPGVHLTHAGQPQAGQRRAQRRDSRRSGSPEGRAGHTPVRKSQLWRTQLGSKRGLKRGQ